MGKLYRRGAGRNLEITTNNRFKINQDYKTSNLFDIINNRMP